MGAGYFRGGLVLFAIRRSLTVGDRNKRLRQFLPPRNAYADFVAGMTEDRADFVAGMTEDRADMVAAGGDFYSELMTSVEDANIKKNVCYDDSIALALYRKEHTLRNGLRDLLHVLRGVCREVPFRPTYVRRYLPHAGEGAEEANSLHDDVLQEFLRFRGGFGNRQCILLKSVLWVL